MAHPGGRGRIDLPYRSVGWVALGLLHASLVVRVAGDAVGSSLLRAGGGTGNVVAVVAFILLAVSSAWLAGQPAGPSRP